MRRVLVTSYYFPPSGGSGVQRTLKFVKYLPQFGWEPIVLTVRDADYPARDESLLDEVPKEIRVYRTFIPEPYRLYRKLTGRKADEALDIATLTRTTAEKRKLSERVAEFVRSCFFIPDARVGWLPFAVCAASRLIHREGITALYSSAPPYTCHLIGLGLKKRFALPWVVDFRDSWVGWLSAPTRPSIPHRMDRQLERAVLKNADRILTVSRGVAEDLKKRNPDLQDGRWVVLPNGYDRSDFEGVKPLGPDGRFTLTYTGSLYGPRNPETLLLAVESLLKERPQLRGRLKLRFVGRIGKAIEEMLRKPEWDGLVEIVPYVSHQESIGYLLSSDVALLIIDDAPANRGILTGKLFEYLGAGKPVLALAPEGDAAELIRELHAGRVVHPKDVQGIRDALLSFYQDWQPGGRLTLTMDRHAIEQFERRNLTRRLAEVFNELL